MLVMVMVMMERQFKALEVEGTRKLLYSREGRQAS